MPERYDSSDLAIVLPVRIDHADRAANMETVLRFFQQFFVGYELVFVEAGDAPVLTSMTRALGAVHRFVPLSGPLHKTLLLNLGARLTERPLAVFYDTDVLFRPEAIHAVLSGLRTRSELSFGIPYNGVQLDISGPDKEALAVTFDFARLPFLATATLYHNYGHDAVCWNPQGVGGATFFKRDVYLRCGGYNEKLVGCYWEDYEIVARFSLMGHPPFWIKDANLYHLQHERTNPGQKDPLWHVNEAEYNRVLSMSVEAIQGYVRDELLPCAGLSGPLPE